MQMMSSILSRYLSVSATWSLWILASTRWLLQNSTRWMHPVTQLHCLSRLCDSEGTYPAVACRHTELYRSWRIYCHESIQLVAVLQFWQGTSCSSGSNPLLGLCCLAQQPASPPEEGSWTSVVRTSQLCCVALSGSY